MYHYFSSNNENICAIRIDLMQYKRKETNLSFRIKNLIFDFIQNIEQKKTVFFFFYSSMIVEIK